MSWQVKRARALQECTDQVEAIICAPALRNEVWTAESLHLYLTDKLGLDYTLEEVGLMNEELHRRGVVEDV